ncbi:MAG: hypothetical protein WKF78_13840 [Candidatus Limnocylindrales bacterium]
MLDFRNDAEDDHRRRSEPWYETHGGGADRPEPAPRLAPGACWHSSVLDETEALRSAAHPRRPIRRRGDHGAGLCAARSGARAASRRARRGGAGRRSRCPRPVRSGAYSFLSQVVDFGDVWLGALYLAARALLGAACPADGGRAARPRREVELTHLRHRADAARARSRSSTASARS